MLVLVLVAVQEMVVVVVVDVPLAPPGVKRVPLLPRPRPAVAAAIMA